MIHVAVSHFFVVEIKGSEQRATRSGVFLATARPQPLPEQATGTGARTGFLAQASVWKCLSCHIRSAPR